MRLGIIGTGRMGHPMARKLIEAGHEVRALARSQDKRATLAADGAHPVASVSEAGEGADAVLVCVFTDEQVQEVCLSSGLLDTMPEGAVLVIHTTGSPRTAENIATRAAPFGISVIDAPVSGGPHDIAAGHLTLFAGGTPAALEQVRPALASYADPILHVGPLGAGQRVKLINNALFAAQLGLLTSAVDLATQLGVDESTLLSALPHGSAASRALTAVASRGSVTAFAASVGDFLAKDMEVARDTAATLGADLGPLDQAITLSGRLQADAPGQQLAMVAGIAEEQLRALGPLEVQVRGMLPGEADAAVDLDALCGGPGVRLGTAGLGQAGQDR